MGLRIEQAMVAALLAVLLGAGGLALARGHRRGGWRAHRRLVAATVALAVAALAARLAICRPTFLHADLRGEPLLDWIFVFPQPADSLGTIGQGSFVVLGALARLFGRSFTTVVVVNQTAAVLALGFAGWAAARFTGRRACAPLVVLLGALAPALARVAGSEDAHNLAVAFGCVALVGMDVYAVERDRAALAAAAAAAALAVCTRQTLYLWAPGVFALGLWRGGRSLLGRGEFLAAGALVAFTLAERVTSTFSSEPGAVGLILPMFSSPRLITALVRHHPLVDVTRFAALLLPLSLAGGWSLARTPGVGRGVLALLAGYFVLTLPMGFPEPGVELAFRLPATVLGLVLAAAGAERLWRLGWTARGGVAIAAVAVPLVLPGARLLREVSPLTVEYEWAQRAARELPPKIALLDLRLADAAPSYRLSSFVFAPGQLERRIDASALPPAAELERHPVYFLAGVQCRVWSVIELAHLGQGNRLPSSVAMLRDLYAAPVERRVYHDVQPPPGVRPECRRVLERSVPVGPRGEITAPIDENPFVLYGGAPIPLGFVRLTAEAPVP